MSLASSTQSRLRVIVLGYVVRFPLGGMAWHYLQYAMGFARLGHDVYYLEVGGAPWSCYDPVRDVNGRDPSYGLNFAGEVFARTGLGDRWAYYDAYANAWHGPVAGRAEKICRSADMLVNVSGANPILPSLEAVPSRVLIDTDPTFTQLRHLTDEKRRCAAARHTDFLSFGENIGEPDCAVPEDGFPWQPTRQPVVLDAWPVMPARPAGPLTTVMQWDSYPPIEYGGCFYGMKSESFSSYSRLPDSISRRMELAVGGARAPREELRQAGWGVVDSRFPTRDPWSYQQYIRESAAEFSVAKHGYVVSRNGWFSERSTCYLASGRPVILQDTGFGRTIPVGRGVVSFSTPGEAVAAVEAVLGDYERHCRAARELAEEYFDSRKALASIIDDVRPVPASSNTEPRGRKKR